MRGDEGAGARYRGDVVRRRLSSGRDEFFITVKRAAAVAAAAWAAMSDRRHDDSIPPSLQGTENVASFSFVSCWK